MGNSGALLILQTAAPTGEKEALQETNKLLAQDPEDQCLAGRVERALHAAGYGPLRRIKVAVQARLVILAGRVASYYLKQIAQTVALTVPGTHQVRNDLEVV
jgi:osmotically-inducible protein OsmY